MKGINPFASVPADITCRLKASRGYIAVKGKIMKHPFTQTLVPVKNELYRLYVNASMLKGADVKVGDTVNFFIEQDLTPRTQTMPAGFIEMLVANNLLFKFEALIPSRQKEILSYLNSLKTEEARERNFAKIIRILK